MRYQPGSLFSWTIALALLLAAVAGCVISPRRNSIVVGPTPTPTTSPTPITTPTPIGTPTPIPVPTPFPTPTPIPAGAQVPQVSKTGSGAQFLFFGDASASLINGFRINHDGSLTPVPGSPFPTTAPVHSAASLHGTLIVANETSLTAFAVDKESGSIQQTDSIQAGTVKSLEADSAENAVFATMQKGTIAFRVTNGKLETLPGALAVPARAPSVASHLPSAVLDASGQFMYVLDASRSEIAAYRVDGGKPVPLSPSAYPVTHSADSLTLVKP